MLRPSSRLLALIAVLAMAGCGSSGDAPRTDVAKDPAPRAGGPMKVAATDGRVGEATAATSSGGVTSLKVRRRPAAPGGVREGVGAGASCTDVDLMPAADNLTAVAAATLCLVNGERADAGLPGLSPNRMLDQSSAAHSQDMVSSSYFAHESQDGRDVVDRIRATGYIEESGDWTVGENLAWGTGTLATPKGIVQAWMDSQGHRENILRSDFKEAGLGIVLGNPRSHDGQGATYTMNFGSTQGGSPAQTVASTLTAGAPAPRTSGAPRRAAARRAATRHRRARSCRARAAKARSASRRKARMKRCARVARRSSRR